MEEIKDVFLSTQCWVMSNFTNNFRDKLKWYTGVINGLCSFLISLDTLLLFNMPFGYIVSTGIYIQLA